MDPICGLSPLGGHICPAPHWNGMEWNTTSLSSQFFVNKNDNFIVIQLTVI